jgi:flagellar hook protein FlgE
MGIFGALTTAVTGMRAQSFSLENISGNIANSQTTAFKRTDTSFQDLVLDAIPSKQIAGSVVASSRATNNVQGDIQSNSISTFMAINGDGFFVVQKPSGFIDGSPTFDGVELYTRRGDFQPDKNGYLVNGAGYFLMGVPVDPTTGNLVGSVPQTLQFQNDFLPAQATSQIDYRLNLPRVPTSIAAYNAAIPNSELLNPGTFTANPVAGPSQPATIVGFGANLLDDAPAAVTGTTVLPATLVNATSGAATFLVNGTSVTLTAGMTPAQVANAINTSNAGGLPAGLQGAVIDSAGHLELTSVNADTTIVIGGTGTAVLAELGLTTGTINPTNLLTQSAVASGQTLQIQIGASVTTLTFGTAGAEISTLAELNTALSSGITGGTGSVDSDGNVTITATSPAETITLTTPSSVASAFGIHVLTGLPSDGTVVGQDVTAFIDQSLGAGAVTAYDSAGSPVNIQLRWAKVSSVDSAGADVWNLFYQVDSTAVLDEDAWKNVGINYTFGSNFQLDPPIATVALNNVVVDGISLGNITLSHGSNGVTQFSDSDGTAQVNFLQQNGYAAGELQSISVSDKGRVVGSYSNGRTIDLAEITLAEFNGPNMLRRLDGGSFAVTDESGPAIYGASGTISGSALEGSNTDIADEFSKLIVTQQAYSANTRIITTGNQMVQDLLNMVR